MNFISVVFIIDGLAGGGAEKVILTLAGAMSKRGVDVTIISLRKDQAYSAGLAKLDRCISGRAAL